MRHFILFFSMVLTLSSCNHNDDQKTTIHLSEVPDIPNYLELRLVGPKWKLIGFVNSENDMVKLAKPSEGDTFTLNFHTNATLSGQTSTNEVFGSYTTDNSNIEFTSWGMTKINELYDGKLYLEAINKVHAYKISNKGLTLIHENDNFLLFKTLN